MTTFSRSLALKLVGWCAALLPVHRASWGGAMKAEVNAIEEENAALSFALGCVWTSIRERTFTLAFAAGSVRSVTMGGMLVLSLASATMTGRMIEADALSALVFCLTAVLFAAAAGWSYLRGSMAMVQVARLTIPFYVLAYVFVSLGQGMLGKWVDERLYRALAIEGIVIWGVVLMSGIFVLRVEALPINRRM